jgi:hypothetical protein
MTQDLRETMGALPGAVESPSSSPIESEAWPGRRMGRRVGRVDVEYSRFGEIFVAGVRFDHDVIVERGGDDAGGRARPGLTGTGSDRPPRLPTRRPHRLPGGR